MLAASLMPISAAGAAETDALQQEIDEVLATTEGGVQISRNEIAWNGGEAILVFPLPGESAAPVSSASAQKLQAKVAGLPLSTTEEEPAGVDPESGVSIAASDSCPTETFGNDWYCFYQYTNYGGRRLQWNASKDTYSPVYFSAYGFENKTSSWSNKGGLTIDVRNRSKTGSDQSCSAVGGGIRLWLEAEHSRSSNVGAADDNKADCFWTYDF
ncbi:MULTISPECIES: peptidase inhibitor family I36 protein [Streptomyces]|uniref:Peptidase inhibitor family I36 protein n=2 Tax=Streptomyces TaxID=1883 RepID=A0ABY9JBM0_9ACTN|nr:MULTISPECIES: peptidase inhibitor family I36 protein [unclassified Streptomyces]WLQ65196.1 peptidase inhibitor family I36 protein [Streptomyces sp. Alt3]WSQ78575.1 peptidase inhibitor family I36 protein [Streptomyces sp. NBC_01213]WSR07955.1 peptidase inhibitor family I36 protein [Streptomyces sp. NBC_01208]